MDDLNTPSKEEQNFADLAAAFNEHQITDDEGKIAEETATENTAAQEENSFEETATSEKTEDAQKTSPQEEESESENELAVDDKGKRYIPEKRLKKETAKRREAEREIEALKALISSQTTGDNQIRQNASYQPISTNDVEIEVLFSKYPQFDPESSEYSVGLDKLGIEIFRANPGISRLKAAKLAIERAKELTSDSAKIMAEARAVKVQQSDQGITNRVASRGATQVDPSAMSQSDREAWLKANGLWD